MMEINEEFNSLLKKKKPIEKFIEAKETEELRKAVLLHLLEGDYNRINEIRENYPIQEMMHLLGRFETIVPIDMDKLFGVRKR